MSEIERLREALERCGKEVAVYAEYAALHVAIGAEGACLNVQNITRAALASTPPVAERGEWRPIESAPRDGRRLLLAGFQRGIPWVAIGHWAPYAGCVWNSDDMKPLQGVVGYQELPAPPSPRETEGQG